MRVVNAPAVEAPAAPLVHLRVKFSAACRRTSSAATPSWRG